MKALYFILFFLPILSYSQEQFFTRFSEKNGLISNTVYKVLQDEKGYIWFATSSGVTKYDGINFVNYSTNDGLTDYDILSIYEDNKGRIWFHTFNGIPCFYEKGKIFNPSNYELLKKIKFSKYISNIYQDHNNTIWVCTSKESYALDLNKNTIKHYPDISGTFFLKKDDNTHIFNGVYQYYDVHKKSLLFTANQNQNQKFSNIGNGLVLNNNTILFFSGKKLYTSKSNYYYYKEQVLNETIISVEKHNDYVFVCTKNGVYKYHQDNFNKPIKKILEGKTVTSFLVDHQNNYWYSTLKGVYVTNNTFSYVDNEFEDVTNISISKKYILSGNIDGYLNLYSKDSFKKVNSYKIRQKPNKIIANEDVFYISSSENTYVIDRNEKNVYLKGLASKSFLINKDAVFIGAAGGLFSFSTNILKPSNYLTLNKLKKLPSFSFIDKERCFTFDLIGDTIFGSSKKYLTKHYKRKTDTLKFVNEAITQKVSGIYYNDQALYLATNSKGLYIYKNKVKVNHYCETNGLFSNQINNLFFKDNTCFIVTKKGIQYVKNNELKKIDLATSSSFTINKAEIIKDKLLLATSEGLLKVDYNNLHTKKEKVKSDITLQSNTKLVSPNTKLDYSNNDAQFTFKVFDYKSPIGKYSYRLSGSELNWNETKSNSIQYKNLSPGNYTFQLKYYNKIINEFAFSIKKPIWKKWWFNLALLFTLGGLFYLFYKMSLSLKMAKAQKKHKINLMIARAEQDALKAQMNPHFIFNSLNAIQNLILHNNTENAYQYLGNFSKLVRSVLNNSRELTTTIVNEIQFLELYLKLEGLRFSGKFKSHINISNDLNEQQIIPSMVIQPFVENAILHGLLPLQDKTDAILTIIFKEDNDFIYCDIEDNGVGRNKMPKKKRNKKSLGLKITQERILLYDESERSGFKIIDKEKGVKVVLKIIKK